MKKNIVSMVTGQASTGREVLGLVAENKVNDNKRYQLTDFNLALGEAVFTEILSENAPEGTVPDVIKINKNNAETMRYIVNPNPKPIPEATLLQDENGKKFLSIEGRKIPLGKIPAIRVIGGVKGGKVLLATEPEFGDGVDVKVYDVQTDTFLEGCLLENGGEDLQLITLENGDSFLINNVIKNVPQIDKDSNPILDENGEQIIRQRCVRSTVFKIVDGRIVDDVNSVDYDEYDDEYDYDDYDYDEYQVPVDTIKLISQGDRSALAIVTTKEVDDEGFLIDAEKATIKIIDRNNCVIDEFLVKDKNSKIFFGGSFRRPPVVTIFDDDAIIINDRYGMKVVDDQTVRKEMEGFFYFLGTEITKDDEDRDVVTFVYGNKKMEIRKFSMVNTDRGTLYEMC